LVSEDLNSFCQFGGHDSKTPRAGHQFYYEWKGPLKDNTLHIWLMCEQCALILLKHPDPTMAILYSWATECDDAAKQLPELLREDPMRQTKLAHYVDIFLDNIRKKQFGGRFPAFIRDINENEKEYFLQELEKDITIRGNFLHDVEEGAKRRTIALKLWVGCMTAAKGTRKTHNIAGGGQEEYTPEQREASFKEADK